jgi:aminoglycoside phosphotransferase (APT) family kinase protein
MPAWTVFTDHARAIFRRAADADAAMWARARGWALSVGVVGCAYFAESNRSFAVLARRIVDEVLAGA